MRDASGQATIEWVGLVLVAALVLGALVAFRAPAQGHGLGTVVAKRITCAAGGTCRTAATAPSVGLPAVPPLAHLRDRSIRRTGARDALRRLRALGKLTDRIWIACLGYRRFVYERDHPLEPYGTMPLGEALEIADTCLNPLGFLQDG